jgi:hypothetical protein
MEEQPAGVGGMNPSKWYFDGDPANPIKVVL